MPGKRARIAEETDDVYPQRMKTEEAGEAEVALMECIICKDELPLSELLMDMPGSAGVVVKGCRHAFCVPCVKALPPNQRKCPLCDMLMISFVNHQCRRCHFSVVAEAAGCGRYSIISLYEGYKDKTATQLRDVAVKSMRIQQECIDSAMKELRCYDENEFMFSDELKNFMDHDAFWQEFVPGNEEVKVCTSKTLVNIGLRRVNVAVAGKWEGRPHANYLMKIKDKTLVGLCEFDGVGDIKNTVKPPPPRMLVAVEEFLYRKGWWKQE